MVLYSLADKVKNKTFLSWDLQFSQIQSLSQIRFHRLQVHHLIHQTVLVQADL